MPLHGFTRMFERMLDHPNIKILLNTDYHEVEGSILYDEIIYTGPIDEYLRLPLRQAAVPLAAISVRDARNASWCSRSRSSTIRTTTSTPAITEFKHLTGQEHPKTTRVYEYPQAEGDPVLSDSAARERGALQEVPGAGRGHAGRPLRRAARHLQVLQHGSGRGAGADDVWQDRRGATTRVCGVSGAAAEALFIDRYGRRPAVHAQAPGRVNLIGEHTDYNDGFVLPVATPQATHAWIAARPDRQVRVYSEAVAAEPPEAVYELGAETRTGRWIDYVAGVTAALRERGDHVGGFDAAITSTLPLGAGLASSAALQVAVLRGLNELWRLGLNALEIARLAHRSETHFAGVPVGIMDQMASSLAAADAALFIDTRSLEFEQLPLPRDTALIVIDSGIRHAHAAGEYRIRRAECQEAAQLLGVPTLRDAGLERPDWPTLPDHLYRRARHVVTENNRVLQAVAGAATVTIRGRSGS